MKALSAAARELAGLFVDDGSLVIALLAWIAATALVAPHILPDGGWRAAILVAGCLLILVENVIRGARQK